HVDIPLPSEEIGHTLRKLIPILLELMRRLERPDDMARRLADNARNDPLPAVQLLNYHMLLEKYAHAAATRQALLAGLDSPSEGLRLGAARARAPEGPGALLELARHGSDEPAVEALAALGKELKLEDALDVLERSLRHGRDASAESC